MMKLEEIQKIAEHLVKTCNFGTEVPLDIEYRQGYFGNWEKTSYHNSNVCDILLGMLVKDFRSMHDFRIYPPPPEPPKENFVVLLKINTGKTVAHYDNHKDAMEYFRCIPKEYAAALWNKTTNELLDFKNISKNTEELIKNV